MEMEYARHFLRALKLLEEAQPMLEFEPSIFKSMIKEITVYPEKFSFVLSNGLVLCEMRR